ncbi:hypothetical protein C0995_013735 [Termitomyces sp. Mi166|nr:hypothetical protein C0995_013735 [Termitomyces sp. Mi166\
MDVSVRATPPPSAPSPATAMSSDATISAEEFTELCKSNQQLHAMMSELLATFSSISNTGTASPAVQAPPATTQTAVPQPPLSMFIPPILGAGSNGTSSASLSLHTQFPDVNTVVITAIIMHEFKAADLHKLNPTNCDKETAYTFNGTTNQFKVSHRAAKEYKIPFSVIIPLQSYFDILVFHVNNAAATSAFFRYTTHLVKLIAKYEWLVI